MKRYLVTGGAGFIGSNFTRFLLRERNPEVVVVLDLLTYAGSLLNLTDVSGDPRFVFVRGDIRDREQVEQVFREYEPDAVVHFAAESHVDRSILDPSVFLTTNVLGTQVLLEAARRHWAAADGTFRSDVRFLQISTDEVYGSLGPEGFFTERTPLSPNSPYSASKASADLVARSYGRTFGLPVLTTRCSNNYGPYQYPEKLIPLMIRNCQMGRPLPVYGDGLQIRDWLYVEDHCSAVLAVLERGQPGEVYNIGGNNEMTNLSIVRLILSAVGCDESLIQHVTDRPGHDRRYAIDSTKIQTELGWRPSRTFEEGIAETVRWYLDHGQWAEAVTADGYEAYYAQKYGGRP